MKAVVVSTPGGPEVLEVVERPKPVLKAGWTLVKIQGFGINHSEIFYPQGTITICKVSSCVRD